jgi:hypothetical protein
VPVSPHLPPCDAAVTVAVSYRVKVASAFRSLAVVIAALGWHYRPNLPLPGPAAYLVFEQLLVLCVDQRTPRAYIPHVCTYTAVLHCNVSRVRTYSTRRDVALPPPPSPYRHLSGCMYFTTRQRERDCSHSNSRSYFVRGSAATPRHATLSSLEPEAEASTHHQHHDQNSDLDEAFIIIRCRSIGNVCTCGFGPATKKDTTTDRPDYAEACCTYLTYVRTAKKIPSVLLSFCKLTSHALSGRAGSARPRVGVQ